MFFLLGRKIIDNDISQSNLILMAYGKRDKEQSVSLSSILAPRDCSLMKLSSLQSPTGI